MNLPKALFEAKQATSDAPLRKLLSEAHLKLINSISALANDATTSNAQDFVAAWTLATHAYAEYETSLPTIEGLCSLGNHDKAREITVTCKTGPQDYKKHFLGLSDNVTFFAEQIQPAKASVYFYRVIFKPSVIIPDIDVR